MIKVFKKDGTFWEFFKNDTNEQHFSYISEKENKYIIVQQENELSLDIWIGKVFIDENEKEVCEEVTQRFSHIELPRGVILFNTSRNNKQIIKQL